MPPISILPGESFVIPTVFHIEKNKIFSSLSGNAGFALDLADIMIITVIYHRKSKKMD